MDAKRFVTGTIVGGIVLFATGFVIFVWLFADFYTANGVPGVDREMQIIWPSLVANLTYGALITYVLTSRSAAITVGGATLVGAMTGFLLWATADFAI